MKKFDKLSLLFILIPSVIWLVVGIIFLCLSMYAEACFVLIPIPMCFLVFYTFDIPKNFAEHIARFTTSIIFRYLFIIAALVVPSLIWKFAADFSNTTSFYWLFFSFGECMITYIMAVIYAFYKEKRAKKDSEDEDVFE